MATDEKKPVDQFRPLLETMFSNYLGHNLIVAYTPPLSHVHGQRPIPEYVVPLQNELRLTVIPDPQNVRKRSIRAFYDTLPLEKKHLSLNDLERAITTTDDQTATRGPDTPHWQQLMETREQLIAAIVANMPDTQRTQFADTDELVDIMKRVTLRDLSDLLGSDEDDKEYQRDGSFTIHKGNLIEGVQALGTDAWSELPPVEKDGEEHPRDVLAVRIVFPAVPSRRVDMNRFLQWIEFVVQHHFAPRLERTRFVDEPCLEYAYVREALHCLTLYVSWAHTPATRRRVERRFDDDVVQEYRRVEQDTENTSTSLTMDVFDQWPHMACIFIECDRPAHV